MKSSAQKLAFLLLSFSAVVKSETHFFGSVSQLYEEDPSNFIFNIVFVVILLVLGGVFAGLTIGLMTLDEVNLELLSKCGSPEDRKYAARIIPIRKDGYFLLVSLLLANTIINETLPIVTDDILGNGWGAILVSTLLLLVFAELIPQAACTKYGLMIGAKFAWLVRILMFIMYPIAYPIARLLEWVLGKHERSFYKRSELKELIKLMGESKIDMSTDEVLIIGGVLELREKKPKNIMTPLDKVFMVSEDADLNDDLILSVRGSFMSRIPVFSGDRRNIVGMMLIKNLLSHDTSEHVKVKDLKLSLLPRFLADHSLFSILHEFKLGKSHLGIIESVVEGEQVPIGIITLEDLIEELIQQEIIDETDQMIDIKGTFTRQATLQGYLLSEMKHGNTEFSSQAGESRNSLSPQSQEENVSELLLNNKNA